MCHGAVIVGGVSARLRGPEVHLQGEVRHRGHPKAAESQNQNDSSPHFAGPSAVKDAVKVNTGDDKDTDKFAVKNAIVSSAFVRLRTIFGEQYLSDPSVEHRRGGIRPIRRHRTF